MSLMISDSLKGLVNEDSIMIDSLDTIEILEQEFTISTIIIDDKTCRILADTDKEIFYSLVRKSKQKVNIKLNNNNFCSGEIISYGWDTTSLENLCLFLIVRR